MDSLTPANRPQSHGPRRTNDPGIPAIEEQDAINAAHRALAESDREVTEAGESVVIGLLAPFGVRARIYLRSIAAGLPARQARKLANLDEQTVSDWRRTDDLFAMAEQECQGMGTGRFESELYRRALAGADDRGSIRALEIVMKQRDPSYRDKGNTQIAIMVQQREQRERRYAGWQQNYDVTVSNPEDLEPDP